MNEKFKEIAVKAQVEHCVSHVRLQEFAELIVRECCMVIDAAKPGVIQVPAEVALDMTVKNVKAYFEVE